MKFGTATRFYRELSSALGVYELILSTLKKRRLEKRGATPIPEIVDCSVGEIMIENQWILGRLGLHLVLRLHIGLPKKKADESNGREPSATCVDFGLLDVDRPGRDTDFFLWVNFEPKLGENGEAEDGVWKVYYDIMTDNPSPDSADEPDWKSLLPDWKDRFAAGEKPVALVTELFSQLVGTAISLAEQKQTHSMVNPA